MKRFLIVLMACVMLLGLCACGGSGLSDGEKVDLFDKYADIILMLENEDYTGAISIIAGMAAEKNPGNQGSQDMSITGDWYLRNDNNDGPKSISVSEDGVFTIDGKEFTLLVEQDEGGRIIYGYLLENGVHTYQVSINFRENAPYMDLWTVRQMEEGYFTSDDHVGGYVNNLMLKYALRSWNVLDRDEGMPESFWLDISNANIEGQNIEWSVKESGEDSLTLDLNGTHTAVLTMRGEYPVFTVTENASGAIGVYYAYDYEYDKSWAEYRYPRLVAALEECVEELADGSTPGFYVSWEEKSVSGNEAWKYLYEGFTALGDYKNSAEYISRFTVLESMYTGAEVVRVDNLGNESSERYEKFTYNSLGQMTRGESYDILRQYRVRNPYFFYDESGKISKIQVGSGDSVNAIITPVYDEQGRMISATAQYNTDSYEFAYVYDAAGRLVEISNRDTSYVYHYTLTYNEAGLLEKAVCYYGYHSSDRKYDDRDTYTYTYDENGYLVSRVSTVEDYTYADGGYKYVLESTTTVLYTNDAQGRPVSATISVDSENNRYASQNVTYTYENLYFYE